jgi:hypothetical protein
MRQPGGQTMSKDNVRSPFCARPGFLPGYRFVFAFLASLVAGLAFAADRDSASGELVRFVRSAAALMEQEGETAFPKFREAGGPRAWKAETCSTNYWPRPGLAEQVKKRAYVRRVSVDGEVLIVGAGLYAGPKQ